MDGVRGANGVGIDLSVIQYRSSIAILTSLLVGFWFLIHRKDANRRQHKVERGIVVANNNSINEYGFIRFVTMAWKLHLLWHDTQQSRQHPTMITMFLWCRRSPLTQQKSHVASLTQHQRHLRSKKTQRRQPRFRSIRIGPRPWIQPQAVDKSSQPWLIYILRVVLLDAVANRRVTILFRDFDEWQFMGKLVSKISVILKIRLCFLSLFAEEEENNGEKAQNHP